MARHEQDLRAEAATPLGVDDLLLLLGAEVRDDPDARRQAIACFLSAGEGWKDAQREAGGAFAEDEAGLKERKAD